MNDSNIEELNLNMCRTSQHNKIFACAAALLLTCGLFLATPIKAHATQVITSIDSTMTITMRQSSDDGSTDEDASGDGSTTGDSTSSDEKSSNENVKSSAASSKKDGSLPRTGVCLLAVIGMIAFCAGSAYCLLESKKRSFVQGAYARKTSRGVYMRPQNPDGAKRRVIVVAVAAVLLAGLCFCAFVLKTDALAETTDSMIKCDSSVKIDESGNVVSSGVTVENNSAKVVGIENAVAPTELSGWQATFASRTVPSKSSVSGTWDGTTVPSDIVAEVKSNGSATLTFQLEVTYDNEDGKTDTKELDYSLFSLEEGEWVYDKTQKTPEVICTGTLIKDTDYTVVYGENVNAGEGTVTITGIGSYSGSKDFKFTIAKAKLTVTGIKVNSKTYDGTTSATFNYDDISVAGKVAGDTVSATATGAFPSANVGTHALALTLAPSGTDAGNYEIDTTASQASAQGVITQKTVKVSGITASNKTYDGSTNATLDVTGLTWDGIEEGDTLSLVAANVTGAFASKNASDTAQTVTIAYGEGALGGTSAGNYTLAAAGNDGSQETTNATISKAALTFIWDYDATVPEYDGTSHTPTLTVTGAAPGETVTPTVTYTKKGNTAAVATPKDAATYVATATITAAEEVNYSLPANTTEEFEIAKAKLTVSGIKVDNKTYDGTKTATFNYGDMSVAGKVGNDEVSATATGAFPSENVGTHTLALTPALTGTDAGNYEIDTTASQASAQGEITKATVTIEWSRTDSFEYNGEDQKREVTKVTGVNNETLGVELEVQKDGEAVNEHKNVGTYVSVATAVTGATAVNYDLPTAETAIKQSFAINKAAITVSGITASNKTYDGNVDASLDYSDVVLAGCVDADKDKLLLTATGAFDDTDGKGKDVGTNKTVNISGLTLSGDTAVLANYELAAASSQQTSTSANITAKEVTITWEPSGDARYAYDGSTHTPTVTVGNVVGGETISATFAYKDSSSVALTSAPSVIGVYTATVTGLSGATAFNYALPATELEKEFDIFELGEYWLAPANAQDPETATCKGQSKVDEDMQVLHGTITQTSTGKDKDAVTAEYTNYMNGKDAEGNSKEMRLYTKWNGEDAGSGANQWVEFRIIQVGAHDDDGSAVTFMATHSLPTAKQMNDSATNSGGWASSAMRTSVFAEGGYVQAGLSGLKDVAKTINKVATSGSHGSWVEGSTTQDKFWLMSYSELVGENTAPITSYGWYKNEGSQYDWCRTNAVANFMTSNVAFAGIDKTRDGSSYSVGYSDVGWWLRSPSGIFSYSFGCVYTDGCPSYYSSASDGLGVVPCFAL
ncbi:YDG domain-containing protein [Bifidobacterium panos]|uniref:Ig-like domain-containing protein n=1 Tax=Bifidobacterium panos TaxID=2675321 RepID=A0ABX1SWJ7_9BIFI|nr:YDG domain-containing protein [Bifidobacterium sp. DSM 109963]NMN02209.1 hypothetical protein [Bifidobacterium sp. DSM 109963]